MWFLLISYKIRYLLKEKGGPITSLDIIQMMKKILTTHWLGLLLGSLCEGDRTRTCNTGLTTYVVASNHSATPSNCLSFQAVNQCAYSERLLAFVVRTGMTL